MKNAQLHYHDSGSSGGGMRKLQTVVLAAITLCVCQELALSQAPAPPAQGQAQGGRGGRGGGQVSAKKRILVFGMTKGFHHDSVSNAMATVWKLGKQSGVWDTEISTDTDILRKGKAPGS